MVTNNSWNSQNPAQVAKGGTGSASFTAYGPVVAASTTTGALTSVTPSATSGVPMISQGSSSNPTFGTAVVAGGGTGVTSSTAYGLIAGGTSSTGAFQTVTPGTAKTVVISGGTAALHSYTSAFKITSDVMTNTAQPAFLAYAADASNVTGSGFTLYQYGTSAMTEIFDQGSNFNTNGTFTAPVTGLYSLNATGYLQGCTVNTGCALRVITSNRSYDSGTLRGATNNDSATLFATLADMDAADTATCSIAGLGEASNTDDLLGISGGILKSYFSGNLVC